MAWEDLSEGAKPQRSRQAHSSPNWPVQKEIEKVCYSRDRYELGNVKIVKNSAWGFLEADEGSDLMYHRNNFYGDNNIKEGDRVLFARHDGLGNDRAFPIVKLRAT